MQTSSDEEGTDREEAGRAAAEDDEPAENAPDLSEYIRISPHFYYHRPEGIEQIWTPEENYANGETLCDFRYDGDLYTVRSYVIDYRDGGLSDIVKEELSEFEGMTFTGQDTVKGRYGDLLRLRFETYEDNGGFVAGTGYYWYESEPFICCLEVTTDGRHDGKAEEMIRKSIYRVSSDSSMKYLADENALDVSSEEASRRLAEDAISEQNKPEPPDVSERIIKP